MLLDEDSTKLVTINTHKGLYQFMRLPFGVASATPLFQWVMDGILQACSVLLRRHTNHWGNGSRACSKPGRSPKASEGSWTQVVEKEMHILPGLSAVPGSLHRLCFGIYTLPDKVAAVDHAPIPTCVSQLRSFFFGMANYYGKLIPNLSSTLQSLHRLLRRGQKWQWAKNCQQAFKQAPVLIHYDIKFLLRLATDASQYGIGAVLSHIMPHGSDRPIEYVSRVPCQKVSKITRK